MTTLREHLAEYLATRRALGYQLVDVGRLLSQFCDWLEQETSDWFTSKQVACWVHLPEGTGPQWRSKRLGAVRGFARYLAAMGTPVEVPGTQIAPRHTGRPTPYLFTQTSLDALGEALTDTCPHGLPKATTCTLVGLLAVTGLRVGEAIALDENDIDLQAGVLTIRAAKGDFDRFVPLHQSTVTQLADYLHSEQRQHRLREVGGPVFITNRGTRIGYKTVHSRFRTATQAAKLHGAPGQPNPTLHHLRHSFAVNVLIDAYRHCDDPARTMDLLATWLGHANPRATYWYMSASPELLALAAQRLQHHESLTGEVTP